MLMEEDYHLLIGFMLKGVAHVIFHGPKDPVYTISVAARLLGVGPQFLRQVENEGLISPARTDSNIRLYSDEDLRLLSRIVYLCRERGVNFQGVRVILAMEDEKRGETENLPDTDPRRSRV